MEESKKIYNIQFIIFAAVALCYLVIALTVGFCLDYDSVVYASILCLPFPLLCG
jgi:hypothetical protein